MRSVDEMQCVVLLAVVGLLCLTTMASADLKMPAIFGDNMVLQAGMEVPVWGTATPGAAVTVACAGQDVHRTAGEDGTWSQRLQPMEYGGPHEFSVTTDDGDALTYSNVYIGEV